MLAFTDPAEVVEEIAKAELGFLNGFEPPDRSRWPRSAPPLSKDGNVALSKTLLKVTLVQDGTVSSQAASNNSFGGAPRHARLFCFLGTIGLSIGNGA